MAQINEFAFESNVEEILTGNGYERSDIKEWDRDSRAPLFSFKKKALVHFAVDTEEVYMTTELKGDSTLFLPFNSGSHPNVIKCGAGNPLHPSGYRIGYFFEEILQRDSFIDIL